MKLCHLKGLNLSWNLLAKTSFIMYNVTRGKFKTAKHTQLGVFVKRKTGSRVLIDCLNRLGHTISYHEVNLQETGFSEKQVEHQLVREYVPPAVQPSTFLTFVYDNCDHKPETLTGATMHCTNGIIIQRKSRNGQPDEAPTEENTNPLVKKKVFFSRRYRCNTISSATASPPWQNTRERTKYKYHQRILIKEGRISFDPSSTTEKIQHR